MPIAKIKIPKQPKNLPPVWKGPLEDGITQSLLGNFWFCRERFRQQVVEGWQLASEFNQRIEYGNMWHVCEEALAANSHAVRGLYPWQEVLKAYCIQLARRFPMQQKQVNHWYEICKQQFPIYVKYWSEQPDVTNRTPIHQEVSFKVPYTLPSGRAVLLRGKWDSVDLIAEGKRTGIWLQENKTKGDIDEQSLKGNLAFDMQTMLYLTALDLSLPKQHRPLLGIRYNVIRRPLAGGKDSIKPLKGNAKTPTETMPEFYARLAGRIQEDTDLAYKEKRDAHYFMRWKVDITSADIQTFKDQALNPMLEQLCDWWEWLGSVGWRGPGIWKSTNGLHWRAPLGMYNPLLEGKSSDLDELVATGSTRGLERTNNLFPELEP